MSEKKISKRLKSKITPKSTIDLKTKDNKKNNSKYNKIIHEFNTNGKLTVVYFCDTYYPIIDGVISVLNNYAKRMAKKCNVVVCVPKHKGKTVEVKDYVVIGFSSVYLKFLNYDLGFPDSDNDFKDLIRKLRIDIIHTHSPFNAGAYAVKLAKRRKIPIVATFHSQFKYDFMKATKSKALTGIAIKTIMNVFNKCTEVWTMNTACQAVIEDYGFTGKIRLVPNATDFVCPENIESEVELVNTTYNLTNTENVFLFVGRLVKLKGILFIADCLKIIKDKCINFKMVYVGDGPDEDTLKDKISELGLEENVILTGKLLDKRMLTALYLRSDLFLLPSIFDASSIVQIEASCLYTPSLLIKDSVTSSTIKPDVNGYVEEFDINKYTEKMINIISDKEKLKQVSLNAHNDLYIIWDDIVDNAYVRYEELVTRNKRIISKLAGIKKQLKLIKKA